MNKEQLESHARSGNIFAACTMFADAHKLPASEVFGFVQLLSRPAETGSEGKVERLRNALQPFAVAASTIAHQKLPAPFSLGYWTEPRPTAVPGVDLPQFVAVLKYEKRHFDEALAAMEATDDWTPTPNKTRSL